MNSPIRRLPLPEPRGCGFRERAIKAATTSFHCSAFRKSDCCTENDRNPTSNFRWVPFWLVVALSFFLFGGCPLSAQVEAPNVVIGPRIAIFGTFNDVKPSYKDYYSDKAVWGVSAGGYLQTPRIFGLEARGSVARWGGLGHQETILFGPRAAVYFWHMAPYISVLGGAANTWMFKPKPVLYVYEQVAPDLSIAGGLDLHLGHRFSLRVGELSYSQIYRSERTITSLGANTGLVYRIR